MDRIAKLETQVFGATANEPPPQPSQPRAKDSGGDDDFDLFGSDDEPAPQPPQPQVKDSGEDDDFDLFGSDDEVIS